MLNKLTEFYNRYSEKFWLKVAYCVPTRLAYWCAIRVAANATTGEYRTQDASTLTAMDAIKRFA